MRREEAEHLIHHHYRLHTQVRSQIDNKPPISMFVSPKSTHYKPFAQRRHRSMEAKRVPRPKGGEELAQFISIKKIPSQSSLSHNIYAKQNSLPSISPSTSTKNLYPNVKSKLLENRNYQPPLHRPRSPRKNSPASQSLNLPPTTSKIVSMMPPRSFSSLSGVKPRISNNIYKNYELVQRRYREFKEQCLSDVLLRGIYSDRVIKDCFYREMERRTDLDYEHMEKIMTETLKELGINMDEANSKKSTVPKKETKVQQAERRVKTIKEKIEETTGSIEELDEDNQSQAESARSRTSSTASSTKSSSSKASKTDSSSSSTASESGSVISVHSSQLSTPPGGRSKKSENGSSPNGSTFSSIHEDDNKEQQTKSPPRDRQHSATTTSSSKDFRLDVMPPRFSSFSSDDFDNLIRDKLYPRNEALDLYDREPSLCDLENLDGSISGDSQLAAIIDYAQKH